LVNGQRSPAYRQDGQSRLCQRRGILNDRESVDGRGGARGPEYAGRRWRLPDDQYGDWSGQLIDSGLAASEAGIA
jgi:hypothetical protein